MQENTPSAPEAEVPEKPQPRVATISSMPSIRIHSLTYELHLRDGYDKLLTPSQRAELKKLQSITPSGEKPKSVLVIDMNMVGSAISAKDVARVQKMHSLLKPEMLEFAGVHYTGKIQALNPKLAKECDRGIQHLRMLPSGNTASVDIKHNGLYGIYDLSFDCYLDEEMIRRLSKPTKHTGQKLISMGSNAPVALQFAVGEQFTCISHMAKPAAILDMILHNRFLQPAGKDTSRR